MPRPTGLPAPERRRIRILSGQEYSLNNLSGILPVIVGIVP